MSNRARWISLFVVAAIVALAVGFFATRESLEEQIDERLGRLRDATPVSRGTRSPEGRELFSRLDAIDQWVRDNTGLDGGAPSPWLRSEEEIVDLPERLERMGAFFQQVDALTDSEACARFLARGERLEMPTRRLMLARTCTNLLCARAWVDQRVAGNGAAAARRLGQALDLARLGDDGSLIGFMIVISNEQYVLAATQPVLADPRSDREGLREVLDAKLARMGDPERLRQTLLLEFGTFRKHVPGRSVVRLQHELQQLEALERAIDLAGMPGAEADAILRSTDVSADRITLVWSATVQSWQLARTRTELGRAALALAAGSEAPLPVDPYTDRPFVRETTNEGERISSPAAMGEYPQDHLLSWTLPR